MNLLQSMGVLWGALDDCERLQPGSQPGRPEVLLPNQGFAFDCQQVGGAIAGQVASAFARLSWPASRLQVEPAGGSTLVNLETKFSTDNVHPTIRTVTLLGRAITVEATPDQFVFVFDDAEPLPGEVPSVATSAASVVHRYRQATQVQPRVDTVYGGRWRVGQGPWRTISGTAIVPGVPVELTVREARPVLVN